MSQTMNAYFLGIAAATAGLCLIWAIVKMIRGRSAVLLWCMLGSILCNPIEPSWDVLGHLGSETAFTMFPDLDIPVHYPWWAALVYVEFSGLACYLFYLIFQKKISTRTFWWAMGGQAVMNIVLEGIVISPGYDYYGYHPWRFLTDFPLWWVFTNYGELLGGALLFLAVRRYGERGGLLAIVIVPSSFGAWELWTGWPVFTAINMDVHPVWPNLAALLTAVIAIGSIHVIRKVMLPDGAAARAPLPSTAEELLPQRG